VRLRLSESATVRLTPQRRAAGHRVGGACVRTTRANRRRPACTRYVVVRGAVTRKAKAGSLRIALSGRRLAKGRLRLVLVASDAAGNASAPAGIAVRVLR